ncbi:MAG TPA: lysophospholipid acyltransferase family protein [Stellaceae bacterium]|jgi:1-acyl-sn-glycerol-3-phosphate acyltransferase|nr:lysophospholipid acyltransferase family protein [Stellaceae bacterium]
MSAQLLRLIRIALYLGLTAPLMPVQAVAVLLDLRLARTLPRWYHRLSCRVLGIRLVFEGKPVEVDPALYVTNHNGYLDIEILGAALEASFISRADVATWPWFGWLAKLQRTVFIERKRREAMGHRNAIIERFDKGDRLILFPEGTSSDGGHVLPFKSSLFSVAEYRRNGTPIAVQPVAVVYTRLDGIPLGRSFRPFFAWYGAMDLAPHLWTALGMGVLTVELTFFPPVTIDQFASRKELAQYCYRVIGDGVAETLAGRKPAPTSAARRRRAKPRVREPVRVS